MIQQDQSVANAELIEMIRQGNRRDILLWMQTPRSNALLSKCAIGGLTPLQVTNPEMLLPRAAIFCRRLSRWLQRMAFRIEQGTAKCSVRYYAARVLQEQAVKENSKTLQRILAL